MIRPRTASDVLRLDTIGEYVELILNGATALRAAFSKIDVIGATEFAIEFRAGPGDIYQEFDTAQRISTTQPIHEDPIDCTALYSVRARIVTPAATSGAIGRITLSAVGEE
jgi:hypothetical protein